MQNCLKPEDVQENVKQENSSPNGDAEVEKFPQSKSIFVSSTPIIIQQPVAKPRTTFAPILPKPPQVQSPQQQQQQQQNQQQLQQQNQQPRKKSSLPAQSASGIYSFIL